METTKTTKEAAPENEAAEQEIAPGLHETSRSGTAGEHGAVSEPELESTTETDSADDAVEDAVAATEGGTAAATPSAVSAIVTGAAAVAGAALALSSLTGTWLSNVVSQRQGLIGQIKTSGGSPKAQIAAGYGTPWHTIALVNGIFAVVALLVCGGVLLHPASRARAARGHWSQALAWGGAVLALIGLLIAGAMWFDLFADLPVVPSASS